VLSARRGLTLVELLVTMVVAAIALTLITAVCLREQRVFTDMADQAAESAQLHDAEAILPIDIRAASSVGGDFRDARDSSVELRGTIASAVVCDTAGASIVLAPATGNAQSYAGFLSAVATGDTAWVFAGDSADTWRPFRVASSGLDRGGACAPQGPTLSGGALATSRVLLALDSLVPATALGAPIRVTRPIRYSLYRGADGNWYLGQRDWSTASARFNSIQPVSGPFLSPAAGGVAFRFLDSLGNTLAAPVANTRLIAALRVELRTETRFTVRALASGAQRGPRVDSSALFVLLRNRR
jgi:prepilin-type N-terminal cleavage/methylation domain-containing protein